jgi:hypothetical protein
MNFFDSGKVASWSRNFVGERGQITNFKEDGSAVAE